jgi:hypothetical protein
MGKEVPKTNNGSVSSYKENKENGQLVLIFEADSRLSFQTVHIVGKNTENEAMSED